MPRAYKRFSTAVVLATTQPCHEPGRAPSDHRLLSRLVY
jgi:hypothetical protein